MQARTLPAARGWSWIVEGFRLFRKSPALVTFLVFAYCLMLMSIQIVPFIGFIAAPLCVPALSVGVMNGCRAVERGEPAHFGLLFSGFQMHLRSLLILGAAYAAASIVVLTVTYWLDGGLLVQSMVSGPQTEQDALRDAKLLASLQVALLLTVPLLMAFWFSPLLAAWHGLPPGKALFFSFVASWRNWRPFFVYSVGVALLSAVLPGIALALAETLSAGLSRALAVAVTLPLVFVFLPTLFASFYVSYRDVFGDAPPGNG